MPSTIEIVDQRAQPDADAAPLLQDHPTQSATTIDGWRSALFGLPFLAAGVWIGLAAFGFVSAREHGPRWLIGIIGGMFFFSGLFLVVHGLLGVARKMRYRRAAAQRPGEPWLYDFHWRPEGIAFSAFRAMLGRLVAALVWNIFLVPFFWIGLNARGARVFLIFACVFALLGLFFWVRWAKVLADLIRHGNSFLSYDNFPYFLGGTLRARLRAPRHISDLDALTLTLRCVQERYVTSTTNGERDSRVCCYELYKDAISLSHDRLAAYAGGEIPLEFRLPAKQLTTSLISTPPVYWEIEARGQSNSNNAYQAYFLVPVYTTA